MFGKVLVVVLATLMGTLLVEAQHPGGRIPLVPTQHQDCPNQSGPNILFNNSETFNLKNPCKITASSITLTNVTFRFEEGVSLRLIAKTIILDQVKFVGDRQAVRLVADFMMLSGNEFIGEGHTYEFVGGNLTLKDNMFNSNYSSINVMALLIHQSTNMYIGNNQNYNEMAVTPQQICTKYHEDLSTDVSVNWDLRNPNIDKMIDEYFLVRYSNIYTGSSQTHNLAATRIREKYNLFSGSRQTHTKSGLDTISNMNLYSGGKVHCYGGNTLQNISSIECE